MNKFIEKLIGRLEEAKNRANRHYNYGDETAYRHSIEIVNQLADNKPIGTGTLEKWAKEIGESGRSHCETTIHVFRKTFASELYRKTKNVKLVSILLGHSSTAVTEKYYLIDDMQEIEHQALKVA